MSTDVRRAIGLALGLVLLTACRTAGGAGPQPAASATYSPRLADIQVVAQGMGTLHGYTDETSVGVVFKDANPTYAFRITYEATLYNAQGAQVGTSILSELDILPGETVAVGNSYAPNPTAPPVRFTVMPWADAGMPCAYPVLKTTKLPAPVPSSSGVWKVNPENPQDTADLPRGTVTGALQVPSTRHGLIAQAELYDSTGHLVGFGSQQLTTAQASTPVLIVLHDSSAGNPNPWGPVAQVSISAHDDPSQLQRDGVLGDCQHPA